MAVFADTTLPKTLPSPLAKPSGTKQPPAFSPPPPMVSDSAVQSVANNQLAAAAGAGRSALAGMDRAGLSRGKGQERMADMAQAGADVSARAQAAQTEMGAAAANAGARQAYENAMRAEEIGNKGLLEGLRTAESMERITKRGWQQDMLEAMRRGQFSLDSMQLDMSPIYEALFRSTRS